MFRYMKDVMAERTGMGCMRTEDGEGREPE